MTEDCARRIVLLKLTTDRHEASCGLPVTAGLLLLWVIVIDYTLQSIVINNVQSLLITTKVFWQLDIKRRWWWWLMMMMHWQSPSLVIVLRNTCSYLRNHAVNGSHIEQAQCILECLGCSLRALLPKSKSQSGYCQGMQILMLLLVSVKLQRNIDNWCRVAQQYVTRLMCALPCKL